MLFIQNVQALVIFMRIRNTFVTNVIKILVTKINLLITWQKWIKIGAD